MTNAPAGRRRWRPRTRRIPAPGRRPIGPPSDDGSIPAGSVQLAIGLLTASLGPEMPFTG